ncbi:MAG: adenylyltransferase [Gammaproteobacteria bacterium RIFCSPHIGHO2_12_FULL_37_14]|nr:MAG: adenylyltransferase [Gammaproteobacteria bacterium RIFCSPHIGHO2_12_FULL_37_14]
MDRKKWMVTPRQRCDLEMLLVGGFYPLMGFLSRIDYESVLLQMRLANGLVWPIPITLDVDEQFAQTIKLGDEIILCDADHTVLAKMNIADKWKPDKSLEAQTVFATVDIEHPGVNYLFHHAGTWYLGGTVELVQQPKYYDFVEFRHTPASLRQIFLQLGWERIIGFQTRNPIHRAHFELTLKAAEKVSGHILIHPVVGLTKLGDIDYFTRVRCYQKILHRYSTKKAFLSLLPLAMRMAGPREALWHAIIRKNYGCTHFIVGRNHAEPGRKNEAKSFYTAYEAQELASRYQSEIGISILAFEEMSYMRERKQYCFASERKPNETALTVSGTALRKALLADEPIPDWFSFPEIIEELRASYPPRYKRGFTLFFTGLSGAGKTTLAHALMSRLMSAGKRKLTLLDGDVIRKILAGELGYSKSDRDLNIRRIGFVAAEITKMGGIAICAAIAPYAAARNENRQLISQFGGYIKVYVATPLSICEKRDTKGLYAKARCGEIKKLTGMDDPYEPPEHPEITIDTSTISIVDSVNIIMEYLLANDYLRIPDKVVSFTREPLFQEEKRNQS